MLKINQLSPPPLSTYIRKIFSEVHAKQALLDIGKFVFALFCIILASLPCLFIAYIGVNVFDEPYQILNALDYKNTPLAPLSNWFGYVFGSTFGWEWIKFRYLAFGLHKLSILIGCYYMWRKTKIYWPCLAVTISLLIISSLFSYSPNLYGWDAWTLPLVVCSIIVVLEYLDHNTIWKIIALGILTAIAGMCRIPNFVMGVFLVAILFFANRQSVPQKERLKDVIVFAIVAIVATFAIITMLYGSPITYLEFLRANSIADHSAAGLVIAPITNGLSFMHYPALLWCCYLAISKTQTRSNVKFNLTCILAFFVLYYFCLVNHNALFSNVMQFILGFEFIVVIAVIFKAKNTDIKFRIISLCLLCAVPFIGSNTGILKTVALPALPILYVFMKPYITKAMKCFSVICFIAIVLYSYSGARASSFGDIGISEANAEFTNGLAVGLKTTEQKVKTISKPIEDIMPYTDGYHNIVLRKGCEYIYEYLLQSRNDYLRHKFNGADDNDAEYVAWVRNEIAKNGDKVSILRLGDCDKPSLMTEALDQLCDKVKDGDGYSIYLKKTNHE